MSVRPRGWRSPAEWITLFLSLLIVGALVAVALVEESRLDEEDVTSLSVTFDPARSQRRDDGYYVPYQVANTGSNAVTSAEIWIEVFAGDSLIESAEIVVEFLPLRGEQDGIYVSMFDPATHEFRGRLESLQLP